MRSTIPAPQLGSEPHTRAGLVFWLAHVYARVLATSMTHRRTLSRSDVREVLRHDLPLVGVTVPLILILVLGALDAMPDRVSIQSVAGSSPRRSISVAILAGSYRSRGKDSHAGLA